MDLWLRTFRSLEGQVSSQVQQMLALELGLLEQYKQWDHTDRTQLLQAIPEMVAQMESVHGQVEALVGWLRRLGAIVEQDMLKLASDSESNLSVLSGAFSSDSRLSIQSERVAEQAGAP